MGGPTAQSIGSSYVLIGIAGCEPWILAKVKGRRRIEGTMAMEVSKVSVLQMNAVHIGVFCPRVFDGRGWVVASISERVVVYS